MKTLICPMSNEQVNVYAVRLTGLILAVLMSVFLLTQNQYVGFFVASDYFIRGFTRMKYSQVSWLALQIIRLLNLPGKYMSKAPKIFAARVGFLFAFGAVVFMLVNQTAGSILGIALLTFNILEALLNICVGCLMYTYVVFPLSFGRNK